MWQRAEYEQEASCIQEAGGEPNGTLLQKNALMKMFATGPNRGSRTFVSACVD